ncbi:MAG TPA: glycosyltransferase family 4 protein [Abditibacteriaceae bacterium]|jgi:glycosyltransferase involved in cell wall biosynthesis|nr:glycosyltransferase family 4 protein [Abditibacteriaceae bacterium]
MTTPIRVLYLDHTAKPSGAEFALVRLLRPIDHGKVTPLALLAEDGPLVQLLKDANVQVRVLPLSDDVREVRKDSLGAGALAKPKQLAQILSYAQQIARFARRNNIQIIHTNSLKAHIYGSIAGKMAKIPVVWHVRDFIDASYLPAPAVKGVRWMADAMPSHIVTVSQSVLDQLQLKNAAKGEVLYDGLGEEEMAVFDVPNGASSTRNGAMRVGAIGRIGPWKGQHIFLDAAAKVLQDGHNARFVVVGAPLFGEDEYERGLHAQIDKLGIGSHVEMLGFRRDVPELLKDLDIVVHASTSADPLPNVVLEGMAAGKPVIGSRGGGVPEMIVDGETGLLSEMGDANELARNIETLLNDSQRAHEMGQAGYKRVRQLFSADRAARQIEDVYARMLAK